MCIPSEIIFEFIKQMRKRARAQINPSLVIVISDSEPEEFEDIEDTSTQSSVELEIANDFSIWQTNTKIRTDILDFSQLQTNSHDESVELVRECCSSTNNIDWTKDKHGDKLRNVWSPLVQPRHKSWRGLKDVQASKKLKNKGQYQSDQLSEFLTEQSYLQDPPYENQWKEYEDYNEGLEVRDELVSQSVLNPFSATVFSQQFNSPYPELFFYNTTRMPKSIQKELESQHLVLESHDILLGGRFIKKSLLRLKKKRTLQFTSQFIEEVSSDSDNDSIDYTPLIQPRNHRRYFHQQGIDLRSNKTAYPFIPDTYTTYVCFKCGSEDHKISQCTSNVPRENCA
ncbi:hypothetical protein FGO68_gene7310 [Halteria grandinella]|uniref:CCHC-type domain-containing protein n=1 Tax=Halteria grandinella TaxID=5974 RepID=A0A8J8ND03_HALGN|nr:hypothetical protein FGO68_gene7310 [Halteria grandinella]